jgi:hypothetical protein
VNYQQISNQTGDWLLDTVQRKPEAVLLIAAGCALLLRSGRPVVDIQLVRESGLPSLSQNRAAGTAEQGSVTESAKAYASKAADTVSEYSDTARQTVSDYAEGARRGISDSSDWLRTKAETTYNTASEALRDQPVLVAALGLAAGAALAAFFPTSEVERRAGAALAAKASEVGDQVLAAAERAGERARDTVRDAVTERVLAPAVKEVVGEVVGIATGAADRGNQQRSDVPKREEQHRGTTPESVTGIGPSKV